MDRPSPSDRLAFKYEGVVIAVVAFALTRGTVADLLVTERGFATEVSAVLVLAVGFGVVLYGINLTVSTRDRTYTRTVLVWFLGGAAAVGLVLGPLLIASSSGDATATAAAVGIVGGGAGLLVGIRGAGSDRRQAIVDRQIEQARLLNRILRHEVRNSVTILRGHSEILFEEREETADRSKTAITDAIARIERAVDETRFLTVGTVDDGSALEPVRLDEAIRRHAERTGREESAVVVPSVTVRADRYLDRLLDELVALPDWADTGADPLAVDVGDRYVELSVTAPERGSALASATCSSRGSPNRSGTTWTTASQSSDSSSRDTAETSGSATPARRLPSGCGSRGPAEPARTTTRRDSQAERCGGRSASGWRPASRWARSFRQRPERCR